jgi:carboxypeptidase family protein/TonB-dependent receptor-like protein
MAISVGLLTRAAALVALIAAASQAAAQTRYASLVGVVRDSAGHPIPGVEVRLQGSTNGYTRTNDSGGFRLPGLPAGSVNVTARRLGFAPASMDVNLKPGRIDSLVLSLTATVAALEGVLVQDEYEARSHRLLAGFWDRRSRGFGNFITREQIEQRDPHDFVDLVRMVPSIQVQTRNGRKVVRMGRGTNRDCPPQYWVDGLRIEAASPDEFVPQDVEAVEVYSGPATIPPQFTARFNSYTCGAIVIWTRIPG